MAEATKIEVYEKALEYILDQCENKSGLKLVDTGNPIHMALYNSLHMAKHVLNGTLTIEKKEGIETQ